MKRIGILISFVIITLSVFAQTEIKTTITNLNLRNSPSDTGFIVTIIPKGTVIQINNSNQESNDWTQVSYKNKTGYVFSTYLVSSTSTQNSQPKYYKNSKGNTVQSPTYYDSAPEGASAECWDGTYSFSQSRRGTCSRHGGVKRWL